MDPGSFWLWWGDTVGGGLVLAASKKEVGDLAHFSSCPLCLG